MEEESLPQPSLLDILKDLKSKEMGLHIQGQSKEAIQELEEVLAPYLQRMEFLLTNWEEALLKKLELFDMEELLKDSDKIDQLRHFKRIYRLSPKLLMKRKVPLLILTCRLQGTSRSRCSVSSRGC